MQKRHVLVCEGSLYPRELPEVNRPGLREAGRYSYAGRRRCAADGNANAARRRNGTRFRFRFKGSRFRLQSQYNFSRFRLQQ